MNHPWLQIWPFLAYTAMGPRPPVLPCKPLARIPALAHHNALGNMNYHTSWRNAHGFVMCELVKMLSAAIIWSVLIVFWSLCLVYWLKYNLNLTTKVQMVMHISYSDMTSYIYIEYSNIESHVQYKLSE